MSYIYRHTRNHNSFGHIPYFFQSTKCRQKHILLKNVCRPLIHTYIYLFTYNKKVYLFIYHNLFINIPWWVKIKNDITPCQRHGCLLKLCRIQKKIDPIGFCPYSVVLNPEIDKTSFNNKEIWLSLHNKVVTLFYLNQLPYYCTEWAKFYITKELHYIFPPPTYKSTSI